MPYASAQASQAHLMSQQPLAPARKPAAQPAAQPDYQPGHQLSIQDISDILTYDEWA